MEQGPAMTVFQPPALCENGGNNQAVKGEGLRHPSSETLEKLLRGELAGRRLEIVLAHLEAGCCRCEEELESLLLLVIQGRVGPEGPRPEDYGRAVRSASVAASARSRELEGERARAAGLAEELCERLKGRRFTDLPAELQERLSTWSVCEELLRRSAEVRFDDPERMVQTARLAVAVAGRLDPIRCGRAPLADLQARAWAELANALRVHDDMRGSDRALVRATQYLRRGTGQPAAAARLAELTASLRAHQRRFREAFQHLQEAQDLYEREKDRTAVGRVLIKRGLYSGYDGDSEGALHFLQQGLRLVSARRDPKLRLIALHNLVFLRAAQGELREARKTLFRMLPLYHQHAGKMDWLRLRGLEGMIAAGLGELDRAERAFRLEKEGFEEAGLVFAAAIADLELVTVWLRMGAAEKVQEARLTIFRLVDVFRGIGVEREALGAILLLSEAQMREALTVELVEATVRVLQQLDRTLAGR
jgi:tetratricopeptide (TPR) repeat protein